jgi:hypothetical protein
VYRVGGFYGSTDTLAFKVAARALKEKIGVSVRETQGVADSTRFLD